MFRWLTLSVLSYKRMGIKLSDIQEKINQAQCPLPLFTCLHVKPDVSELMFAGKYVSSVWHLQVSYVTLCILNPSKQYFAYPYIMSTWYDDWSHMQNKWAVHFHIIPVCYHKEHVARCGWLSSNESPVVSDVGVCTVQNVVQYFLNSNIAPTQSWTHLWIYTLY